MTPRRPALRYHGGKWRLAPWIISHFPPHQGYVEPFGGAASVLLQKPRSKSECYNDLDGRVVNFFRVLQDKEKAAELRRLCSLTPYARTEFLGAYRKPRNDVEDAHRLVILSFMGHGSDSATRQARTGFRGRKSVPNASPAVDWSGWPDHVPAMTRRLAGVVIEHDDAKLVIQRNDARGVLHYVDPPYVFSTRACKSDRRSGRHGYAHELTDADHAELSCVLKSCKGMVVISGYRSDLYAELYREWQRFDTWHTTDLGHRKVEALWLNQAAASALRGQQRLDFPS